MRRLGAIAALAALLFAGCVSAPSGKAPEPKRTVRTETVRVPVIVKETSYFANGALDRTVSYVYDPSLQLLLERVVQEPSRSEPTEKTTYGYSGNSLASVTVLNSEGKVKTRTAYETDASGRVIRETVYDAKDIPQTQSRYEYDSAGRKTSRKVYDGAGVFLAVSEYSYKGGRLEVVLMKDAAERPAGRIEHEYDAAGCLVARTSFDPTGAVSQRENFTYVNGVLVEEKTESGNGRTERRVVYEIGPDGVPIKSTLRDSSERIRDIRVYEYVLRTEERPVADQE
jgi:hypothetical protein